MKNRKIEILLVEDNQDDACLITRALRKYSFVERIVHLHDGKEALDFLHGEEHYINGYVEDSLKVILLDLRMPRVNGYELLKKIKADVLTMYIPVIILAFSDYDPDIEEAYKLGAYRHIVKSVDYTDFFKAIAEINLYFGSPN